MRYVFIILLVTFSLPAYSQDYNKIRKELEAIRTSDQQYRIVLDFLVRIAKKEWKDPEIQRLLPFAAQQDSVNLAYVTDLINHYGWIGNDKIGDLANESLFPVVQHADHDMILKFFPYLVQSYETGNTPARFYAMMLDRLLVESDQKQVFGTQNTMELKDNAYQLFPVIDEVHMNKRREKVGLKALAK